MWKIKTIVTTGLYDLCDLQGPNPPVHETIAPIAVKLPGALLAGAGQEFRAPQITPDDLIFLQYTGGTTGLSKGAMLTQANLVSNARTLAEAWRFEAGDTLLHVLPIFHAHGLFVGLGCVLMSGASMQFIAKFDVATVVTALPASTVMMGIPTFYTRLLKAPAFDAAACKSMRLFISGSAPLPAQIHAQFAARSGHAILERYGMTETSMLSSNPLVGERRPGTVGPPLPGVTIRVVDDDERTIAPNEIGAIVEDLFERFRPNEGR